MKKFIVVLLLGGTVCVSVLYSAELRLLYLRGYYRYVKKETIEDSRKFAHAMYRDKKYEDLKEYLDDMLVLYPVDRDFLRLNGMCVLQTGNRLEGARMVIATLAQGDDITSFQGVIEILFDAREYAELTDVFKKMDPSRDSYLSYVYGVSLYQRKEYGKALKYLTIAERLGKRDIETYLYRGLACVHAGLPGEAVAVLERAYAIDPVRADVREALAGAYRAAKMYEKAALVMRRGIK